jgi:hypothetical protein
MYIKKFEELDFFKKLARSAKPEKIGREPIYGGEPKKKEPNPTNTKLGLFSQTIEWFNSDKLRNQISDVSPGRPNLINITLNNQFISNSIKSNNTLSGNIRNVTISLDMSEIQKKDRVNIPCTYHLIINLNKDLNYIFDLGPTKTGNLDYKCGLREFKIGYSVLTTSEGNFTFSNINGIASGVNNIISDVGSILDKISDVILSIVSREKTRQHQEKIRQAEEAKEKVRLHEFASHLEEISDYLVELEDLAGGSKYFSKKVANYYMWFEYKIDNFKINHDGDIIINDTAVDVLKAVANAKKQIIEHIPECEVATKFTNGLVKVYIRIEPKIRISRRIIRHPVPSSGG